MMVDFNRVFLPTKEQQIEDLKKCIEMHNSLIGDCVTCVHYTPSDLRGFVTDYGNCSVDEEVFMEKIFDQENAVCNHYEHDDSEIQLAVNEINKLKEGGIE